MDTGVFLLPRWGIGQCIIISFRILTLQAAVHAKLGHDQVEDRGHRHLPLRGLYIAHRHGSLDQPVAGEIVEFQADLSIVSVNET